MIFIGDKKEKLALILLAVFALLLGVGFYIYYRMNSGEETLNLNKPQNDQKIICVRRNYTSSYRSAT